MTSPADDAATFCATLVDEFVRCGVVHCVVSPGSRSTPMALALVRDGRLAVHVFHDERSASFAALGIGKATMMPSLLLCTSGTAAAQFHAAVVEAHQSAVPMIVLTADRPPELHGRGAPQTIDQQHLFGSAVRAFHDAGVPNAQMSPGWRPLARNAVATSLASTPGPVHINLPFREPLLGTSGALPEADAQDAVSRVLMPVCTEDLERVAQKIAGRRGVLIAGGGSSEAVDELAEALGWPIFADVRSGARSSESYSITAFDPILRSHEYVLQNIPEVVVRLGEPPASKVLSQWIATNGISLIQINSDQRLFDPDSNAHDIVTADLDEFCQQLAQHVSSTDSSWLQTWIAAERAAREIISSGSADFTEPMIAVAVVSAMAPGDQLVVSSSMPIRDIEWFTPARKGTVIHSNRGANGIDGVVSTAVGVALATGARTTLYIGDVACVHDANGLWNLVERNANLRIVVTNNSGGSIFSFLPQATGVDVEEFEKLFGTPHAVNFADLASAHRIPYQCVTSTKVLHDVLTTTDGPILIEVVTDRDNNVAAHERLNAAIGMAVSKTLQ